MPDPLQFNTARQVMEGLPVKGQRSLKPRYLRIGFTGTDVFDPALFQISLSPIPGLKQKPSISYSLQRRKPSDSQPSSLDHSTGML